MSLFFLNNESSLVLLERYFSVKNETHDLKPLSSIFNALQKEDVAEFVLFLRDNEEIRANFI